MSGLNPAFTVSARQQAVAIILMERAPDAEEQLSIFSLVEPSASPSPSPDSARDWMTRVVHSCLSTLPWLAAIAPAGWSGRTCPVSCPSTTDGRLAPCSEGWLSSGMGSPTAFLTLSTSDWPSDGSVCSLSAMLEATGAVPPAVLFERESLSGHPAPRRAEGERLAPTVSSGPAFSRTGNERVEVGTPLVPVGFNWQNGGGYGDAHDGLAITDDGVGPLSRSQVPAVAFHANMGGNDGGVYQDGTTPTVTTERRPAVTSGGPQVRRLTPLECERLQGFPDGYTDIPYRGKPAADGPRYKALGNSMAVPVMAWIGRRMQMVEEIGGA